MLPLCKEFISSGLFIGMKCCCAMDNCLAQRGQLFYYGAQTVILRPAAWDLVRNAEFQPLPETQSELGYAHSIQMPREVIGTLKLEECLFRQLWSLLKCPLGIKAWAGFFHISRYLFLFQCSALFPRPTASVSPGKLLEM